MHLAMLSAINNDALAELILAFILFVLVQRLMPASEPQPDASKKPYFQNNLLLGIVLGLGLGTKIMVYIAIPLIALTLWWTSHQENSKRDWRKLLRETAIIYGVALLIILPWYVRNAIVYGNIDILGMVRHDQIVTGQLRTADYMAQVGIWGYLGSFFTTTYHSFWGQFGWMAVPMDSRAYLVLTLLSLMALGGLIGFWRGTRATPPAAEYALSGEQRYALGLMGAMIIFMIAGYLWYNLEFVQFQGRYLFPALIPWSLFFALGLHEALSPRRQWWLAGGLAITCGWVVAASLLQGDLDKWAALITGSAMLLAAGRAWLNHAWSIPASRLMTGCYTLLALLALASPFWFIIPHLSP
jgi:4-amino-4-deoxy-L-arabinose transferase-like glycosyltransferase